jgi:hypothetical protein
MVGTLSPNSLNLQVPKMTSLSILRTDSGHSHVRRVLYAHTPNNISKLPPDIHDLVTFYHLTARCIPRLQLHPVRAFHCELRGQTPLLDKTRKSSQVLCY